MLAEQGLLFTKASPQTAFSEGKGVWGDMALQWEDPQCPWLGSLLHGQLNANEVVSMREPKSESFLLTQKRA